MIISRTPFRVSLFGGGSDYPQWYKEHGGAVLGFTINKYCYISLRRLPPFFMHKHRIVYSKVETVNETADIQHPAARHILQDRNIDFGLEIHHDGDLPARSGLGSSSSFTVGLLNALYALDNRMMTKRQLAEERDSNRAGRDRRECRLPGPDMGKLWRHEPRRFSPRRRLRRSPADRLPQAPQGSR